MRIRMKRVVCSAAVEEVLLSVDAGNGQVQQQELPVMLREITIGRCGVVRGMSSRRGVLWRWRF